MNPQRRRQRRLDRPGVAGHGARPDHRRQFRGAGAWPRFLPGRAQRYALAVLRIGRREHQWQLAHQRQSPPRPKGRQSASSSSNGSMSYSVYLDANTYNLSFLAAQRAKYQTQNQEIQVLVDSAQVGVDHALRAPVTPLYQTANFTVAAGTHTIQFVGLSPQSADSTAFIDEVSVVGGGKLAQRRRFRDRRSWPPTPTRRRPAVPAGSFPGRPGSRPMAAPSPLGSANAPDGNQVAFIKDNGRHEPVGLL